MYMYVATVYYNKNWVLYYYIFIIIITTAQPEMLKLSDLVVISHLSNRNYNYTAGSTSGQDEVNPVF